jgi:hypothetical protein
MISLPVQSSYGSWYLHPIHRSWSEKTLQAVEEGALIGTRIVV